MYWLTGALKVKMTCPNTVVSQWEDQEQNTEILSQCHTWSMSQLYSLPFLGSHYFLSSTGCAVALIYRCCNAIGSWENDERSTRLIVFLLITQMFLSEVHWGVL